MVPTLAQLEPFERGMVKLNHHQPRAIVFTLGWASDSPVGLVSTVLGPPGCRFSRSDVGQRIPISNKFPSAASPGAPLGEET